MKILLPTDFSENARNAAEYGIQMFGDKEVTYLLLNAYLEPRSSADMLVSIRDILERQSRRSLFEEYTFLSKKFPHLTNSIEQKSVFGQLPNEINSLVEKEKIDFIVMGTKGASGIKKMFMGSTTARLIKKVKCPVLAIPENAHYKSPLKIALATDYLELKDEDVLDPLAQMVTKHQTKLMIVNVRPEDKFVKAEQVVENIRLHNSLKEIPHLFYNTQHKHTIEGIVEFVHENKIDVLAMVARQHHLMSKLTKNSLTNKMAMLTDIPLLVLHEK